MKREIAFEDELAMQLRAEALSRAQVAFDKAKEELEEAHVRLRDEIMNPLKPVIEEIYVAYEAAMAPHRALERRHPGWENTVKTTFFRAWLDQQPAHIRCLQESHDPNDASALLDRYAIFKKVADQAIAEGARS